MSKELEAFDRIMKTYGNTNSLEGTYNDFLTIKQALQRLEQIENAKPSEVLDIINKIIDAIDYHKKQTNEENSVACISEETLVRFQQALTKAQEQEKVLEIIKERHIDILSLEECIEREKMGNVASALEIVFKLAKQRYFYYEENEELHLINCFDIELFNNKIYFDESWIDHDIELGEFGTIELPFNDYKKTWWLKEDKSE